MARISAKKPRPQKLRARRVAPTQAVPRRPIATCGICGEPIFDLASPDYTLELDHVYCKDRYPHLRKRLWNLQPAHRICNRRKGDREPTLIEALRASARRQPELPPRRARRHRLRRARRIG